MPLKVQWGGGGSVRLSMLNIGARLGWAINDTPRLSFGDLFCRWRPDTQFTVHDIGSGRILKIVPAPGFKL